MTRTALTAALLGALVTLSACGGSPDLPSPSRAQIDVDTPQLRAAKARADVAPCAAGPGEHVDGGLPAVTLPCLGGGEDVDVSTLRGPMVVNLWAVWCGPCREELPIYQRFHERYGDRVAVLGIDYQDTQPAAALDLVRETGVTYPLLADPQSALSLKDPLPNIQGLPYLALVDEDGVVVHQEFVEVTSLGQLERLVDEHLGVDL
ncbi:TlpA family protein disulfide reductase [Nocardioides donggukensis]|uniref:TlpA family protein disulfide reductase n=1 Tax=Nocardioides donggukensis TaxID=2774019 RepID=A0A927K663_9ACTN|nr:TlpA disulfide reductase family protein [Nocardioides donggukensis]MBD8870949.1 TlpA family protein disulfide reductase [Nocardioides donggukensis]